MWRKAPGAVSSVPSAAAWSLIFPYHSIADVVYIFGAWKWDIDLLWFYPIIVIGNYVGCNVRRWLLPETNPSA